MYKDKHQEGFWGEPVVIFVALISIPFVVVGLLYFAAG